MIIKKLTAAVMSALCAFQLCAPASAYAEETKGTYGVLKYTKLDENKDGTYDGIEITWCDYGVTDVAVPAEIEGLPVISIGGNSFYGRDVVHVELPETLKRIRYCAFCSCDDLKEFYIPSGVELIEENSLFYWCDSVENVYVSENNPYFCSVDGVLYSKDKTTYMYYPVGRTAETVLIPEGVTRVEAFAFNGCESVKEVILPQTLISIGDRAFDSSGLTNVTIPESVQKIDYDAFGYTPFWQNQFGVIYADSWVLGCDKNITEAVINDGIKHISDYAFRGCNKLKTLTLPDSLVSIGKGAFYECWDLETIVVPTSVSSIDESGLCAVGLEKAVIKNPVCEISDDDSTIWEKTVIYGYDGSTAQAYAEKYGRKFMRLIGDKVCGDISGNDSVDLYDAIEIAKANMGMRELTEEELTIADFNSDGVINLYDVIAIAKYIMG